MDSIVVYNTGGVYDPILKKWEGKGGKVTWEKVNLPANETFAELKNLEINMKTSGFGADSVLLTSPYFPGKKVLGKLNERASRITREVDKIFPEFISYEKKLTIKNLREEMDYAGGFSLQGASLIGLGSPKDPATITIYRNAKPFIVAQSQLFNIATTKIHAYSASVNMRVGEKDSVFHPGLDFTFFKDSNLVALATVKTVAYIPPFSD